MSISTYAELVTAITNWTHRSDLASVAPEFITLAEHRIYHGNKDPQFPCDPLRISAMQSQDTGNASSGAITLPTRYLETIRLLISINSQNRVLRYRSPQDSAPYESLDGTAQFYTIVNNAIKVGPPTAGYTHDYYASFLPLNSTNTTNSLLTAAPSVYLHGSLIEAWMYVGNIAKAQLAYRAYMAAVNALQNSDRRKGYGSAALQVMPG